MVEIECLLCGKEYPRLNKVEIEGTVVEVCDKCLRFGTRIIDKQTYEPFTRKIEIKILPTEEELISKYGETIRKFREAKGLTRIDFAKVINEKESVIKRIEEENMEPDKKLIKKIESFLGVKLMKKYEEEMKFKEEKKKPKLTVGDVVKVR